MFYGIQLDSPANLTNDINRKTLTSNDAKGIKNAFTNARITLSNVLPIRNTKDKDYPLWPLIKFVRIESDYFEDDKLAILREISDILLQDMPNYKTNNNFKEYKYQDLIRSNDYVSFTELEKIFLDIMAKSEKDMLGIGIIYGNDRLIRGYINTLLNLYKEAKANNKNLTAQDILNLILKISIRNHCVNDFINNYAINKNNLNKKEIKRLHELLKEIFEKLNKRYKNNLSWDGELFNEYVEPNLDNDTDENQNRNTNTNSNINRQTTKIHEVVDLEGTPNCPSAGKNPNKNIPYREQALIFHPDRNSGCKNKDAVNNKFLELKSMFNRSGGKRRKSKRRKSNKRRNTKRRYRK